MKVTFSVSTNKVGSGVKETVDILELTGYDLEGWNELSDSERSGIIQDCFNDWIYETANLEWWYEED